MKDLQGLLEGCVADNAKGAGLRFAIRHGACGQLVGMTGLWQISAEYRRLEIGGTWVTRDHQRTEVNTECERLLLARAFEVFHCLRVEFKTVAVGVSGLVVFAAGGFVLLSRRVDKKEHQRKTEVRLGAGSLFVEGHF